jgi:hypothetical protein
MGRRSSTLAAFNDPDGQRYGIPTFPWNGAWNLEQALAKRRQLAAAGLRPGGQEPAGQLMWRSRRARTSDGVRTALLYRVDLARPRRSPTPAQQEALARALAARMTCRREAGGCGRRMDYVILARLGVCLGCADPGDVEALCA